MGFVASCTHVGSGSSWMWSIRTSCLMQKRHRCCRDLTLLNLETGYRSWTGVGGRPEHKSQTSFMQPLQTCFTVRGKERTCKIKSESTENNVHCDTSSTLHFTFQRIFQNKVWFKGNYSFGVLFSSSRKRSSCSSAFCVSLFICRYIYIYFTV